MKNKFFILLLIVVFSLSGNAQSKIDSIRDVLQQSKGYFSKNTAQKFGFHRNLTYKNKQLIIDASKSIEAGTIDWVNFDVNPQFISNIDSVHFFIDEQKIDPTKLNRLKCALVLPARDTNYMLVAKYRNKEIANLKVFVFRSKTVKITLVPLVNGKINADSIEEQLNLLFSPAVVKFDIVVKSKFRNSKGLVGNQLLNPSSGNLRYTMQMQHIRDEYFEKHKLTEEDGLLFFITPNFQDTSMLFYMVRNKAMGFLSKDGLPSLARNLANSYMLGYINSEFPFSSSKLFKLSDSQWIEIQENPQLYSYVDDYEEVVTNNGLIAYYYFEQNKKGEIQIQDDNFLSTIQRPIKKNTYSYHLQIDNWFYKTLFEVLKIPVNILHVICISVLFVTLGYSFFRIKKYLKTRFKMAFLFRTFYFVFQSSVMLASCWAVFLLINLGYAWFEVNNGMIKAYSGLSKSEVLDNIFLNVHPNKIEEKKMGSELVVKQGNDYFVFERKKVLYFKEIIDSSGKAIQIKLLSNSDSLKTQLTPKPVEAKSHYIVVKIHDENGKWIKDLVYNHLGVNLSEKLNLADPPKRILLFVNGYRPTSLGASFEDNFADIQKYGLEFPNSSNRIYTEDRYNYWHPWMEIDDQFKARINPTETYYADGHHSVSTSNHRSLLKFTTYSQVYPKRCVNPHKHTCQETQLIGWSFFDSAKKNTYNLLATRANMKGFKIRQNSGRVAGRNFYQLLNELPNLSNNDTLYIVAHSMGFAYAQGIIEQLKGKINLGGYYIIAPENAKSGNVDPANWKEIWQYGSNLGMQHQDEPCLQDGIAPQSTVGGLPLDHRITIPNDRYNTKGYFDSHFIGWYTWILKIPSDHKGYILQN